MYEIYNIYEAIEFKKEIQILIEQDTINKSYYETKNEQINEYLTAFSNDLNNRLNCGTNNACEKIKGINYYDLTIPSNLTVYELSDMLSTIEHSKLQGLSEYFILAEQEFGVNALFLASLASLESFYGNSDKAENKNNLFGFGSNDYNDMTYTFKSKQDGILYVAEYLSENYFDEDGKYYNGNSIWNVNSIYCPDIEGQQPKLWSEKIIKIANKYLDNLNNII